MIWGYKGSHKKNPPFGALEGKQPGMRGLRTALAITLLGWLSLWDFRAARAAESNPNAEYSVKAVFLLNFARFTEWPEKSLPAAGSPLVIGVLGDNPFGTLIEQAIRGETVHGRHIEFRHFPNLTQDFQSAHVLFVSRSRDDKLPAVVKELNGAPVLIVGEAERFAQRGGMINFVIVENRVRFEVNQATGEQAGLKLSSKLLNLPKAIRVTSAPPKR